MGVVGRLDQYASMLCNEFDETTANNPSITGLGTYYASEFSENVGITTTLDANVFAPYDPVYDEFGGTLFGAGQGRYMRQNTDKSVIIYNEIDEVTDLFGRGIIRDGLVLDLDAGISTSYPGSGTTWTDLSVYSNNGTLTNGPTYSSSNGGSIVFDGVDDKVTFPNNTISTSAGMTVEVWFKTSSGTKYQDIFDLDDAYGVWIVTNFSASGKINASFNTLSGYMTADYVANNWYQVVLSGSGTSNFMYLNGVQVATASQTVATSINLNTARIGNVDGDRASEYLVGNVSCLKLYNRALTSAEISQNYNALKDRFGL
jgi:hypothetical protein